MRLAALFLASTALLIATAAIAYVQDRSPKTGRSLRWKGGVLTLTLARTSPSQDLSEPEVRRAVAAALALWDRRNNPCSSVELRLAEGTTDNEVVEDGISSTSFREERWSRAKADCSWAEAVLSYLIWKRDGSSWFNGSCLVQLSSDAAARTTVVAQLATQPPLAAEPLTVLGK
jgi:hypothetical protein